MCSVCMSRTASIADEQLSFPYLKSLSVLSTVAVLFVKPSWKACEALEMVRLSDVARYLQP